MTDFRIALGVNIFLCCLLLMVIGELFTFHVILIYKNITTYDFIMASKSDYIYQEAAKGNVQGGKAERGHYLRDLLRLLYKEEQGGPWGWAAGCSRWAQAKVQVPNQHMHIDLVRGRRR